MSLINDALKKAGQQVDRQNAGKLSTDYSMAPSHLPHRFSLRILAVLLAILTVAAVLTGLFIFRSKYGGPRQQIAATQESFSPTEAIGGRDSTPTAAPAAETGPEPSPSDEGPRSGVTEATAPTQSTPPPAAQSAGNGRRTTRSFERRPRTPAPSDGPERAAPPRVTTASPPPTKAQTPSEPTLDGQSFLKRVRVPGHGTIVLSGIAWSEVNPVAVISGAVVSPGERVKGFTVTRIQQNSVELSNKEATFTIRLR